MVLTCLSQVWLLGLRLAGFPGGGVASCVDKQDRLKQLQESKKIP